LPSAVFIADNRRSSNYSSLSAIFPDALGVFYSFVFYSEDDQSFHQELVRAVSFGHGKGGSEKRDIILGKAGKKAVKQAVRKRVLWEVVE